MFSSGNNLYLKIPTYMDHPTHRYIHLDKENLTFTTIINNNFVNEMHETNTCCRLDNEINIYVTLMISDKNDRHYIIHNDSYDYKTIIDEKTLMNIYNNGNKLKFKMMNHVYFIGAKLCIGIISSTKTGIINHLRCDIEYNNYMEKIMQENEKIKKICIKELLLNYYSEDVIDSGFKNDTIKVFENDDKNIILFGKNYVCYDLNKRIILDHIDIEEYLAMKCDEILYVHALNNHHYFVFAGLKDYRAKTFTLVWRIIFTSMKIINKQFDLFFHFD